MREQGAEQPDRPDDVRRDAALAAGIPAAPGQKIPRETRAVLRELCVADYLPGIRCVTEAMLALAASRDALGLDPERVCPAVARCLGLTEAQVGERVGAVIASMTKNCPPEVFQSLFPEGVPNQRLFLERVFEQLYCRLGRELWGR